MQIGAGSFFVPMETLFNLFAPYGFTPKSFHAWLRALGVCPIRMPNGTLLVNYFKFILALEVITLNHTKVFFTPHYVQKKWHKQVPSWARVSLTEEDWAAYGRRAISELLLARRMPGLANPPALKEAFDVAITAMCSKLARIAMVHTQDAAASLVEEAETEGLLDATEVDEDGDPKTFIPDPMSPPATSQVHGHPPINILDVESNVDFPEDDHAA